MVIGSTCFGALIIACVAARDGWQDHALCSTFANVVVARNLSGGLPFGFLVCSSARVDHKLTCLKARQLPILRRCGHKINVIMCLKGTMVTCLASLWEQDICV